MTTLPAKITAATFKSFIRKNAAALHINVTSKFDGMTDGVESRKGGFRPLTLSENSTPEDKHTLGYSGIWLVGSSRDYFQAYNKDGFTGIEVSNSCGSFTVALPST